LRAHRIAEAKNLRHTERDLAAEMARIAKDRLRLDEVYTQIRRAEAAGRLPGGSGGGSGAAETAKAEAEIAAFAGGVARERREFRKEIQRDERELRAEQDAGLSTRPGGETKARAPLSKTPSKAAAGKAHAAETVPQRAARNMDAISATHALLDHNAGVYDEIRTRLVRYKSEIKRIESELAEELVAMSAEKRDLATVLRESREIAAAIRTNAVERDAERRELNALRWAVMIELLVGGLILVCVVVGGSVRGLCCKGTGDSAEVEYTPIATSSHGLLMDDIGDARL
jgi:hypothetical protein